MQSDNLIKRVAERVSMLISATVYAEGQARRAIVGNISPFGAMIESKFVPEIGSSVSIRRGRLLVTGRVVWAKNGRFGVSFPKPTEVQDWLTAPMVPFERLASGALTALGWEHVGICDAYADGDIAVEQEDLRDHIHESVRMIAILGDRLAEDLTLVGQNDRIVQKLESAMQILRRIRVVVP